MVKILTFGEILLRMSPVLEGQWIKQASIPTFIGGAELNVAMALAKWQVPVAYCSAMPENSLTAEIKSLLNTEQIDTQAMQISGERLGIYFLPQGLDLKNGGVIYDRNYSSFSQLKVGDIDWNTVFEGVDWFHFSAISPALSQNLADVCLEAIQVAHQRGLRISVDLNYRAKLWQYGRRPVEIMPNLVQYCHLVMGNLWAAKQLLGIEIDAKVEVNQATKAEYLDQGIQTATALIKGFENCSQVAQTFRFDNESGGINYYASLFTEGKSYISPEYVVNSIKDKIGSGDCFMAGLIYGNSQQMGLQDTIDFAAAAAIGKLQEIGDFTQQSVSDILTIQRSQSL
jgi:2-dehydro-3-deoxygluconokinase